MFIREEWIQNTEFFPESTAQVLNKVLEGTQKVLADKKLPVVVFDLDSTLFDVSRRSYEILNEWRTHTETKTFQETAKMLADLSPTDMRYSLEDVWNIKKIPHDRIPFDHHFKHAKQFWKERFFGGDFLKHDQPTRGAVEFVKKLHAMGAKIVYLTGRDVPLMAFGTFDQLKQHGLPIEVERTRLILKPKRHLDDLDFKSGAAKLIQTWGTVIASFENEPKNLIAMAKVFTPETMNIFIESVSSDHPAPGGKGIYRIREFHF
ncbi:MAG: HAD family hydrolase [Bdellovibrionales bacterium]|nr:HAD family hydrolase [Oligoflexia bacterium]